MQARQISRPVIKRLWRAVMEFDMLSPGDRVLVGLSGGKDSAFLLYGLSVMRDTGPFSFEVGAVTLDLGFEEAVDFGPIRDFCAGLNVPWKGIRTQIGQLALMPGKQNPCAKCAFFRRGAIADYAVKTGYNKLALGHHWDDTVETFLMSQLYSGQLKTFLPTTVMENTGLVVIRPLVYLREYEVSRGLRDSGFVPVKSPCPLNGTTKRSEVKELLRAMEREHPGVFANLSAAMREGDHVELWPRPLSREEMRVKYIRTMHPRTREKSNDSLLVPPSE